MGEFAGKVAIVTGAGSGIGRATALRLAAGGARVACLDVNEPGNNETVDMIKAEGGEAIARVTNVADELSVKSAIEATVEAFGGIQILANVAGIGFFRHTHECALEDWNRVLAVNLTGVFLMTRDAMPYLLEHGGSVVNVASIAGVKGHPYAAAYCASKGGVVQLTRGLAIEYAKRNVRVNCICPSGVNTNIIASFVLPDDADEVLFSRILAPNEGFSEPDEVASMIAYLCSDAAVNITGASMIIDGGVSA